jgi:hypothetical protein
MLNNNYKNEAIKLMDQLKKAKETRIAMIKEAQETLVVLGAESTVENVINNVININKGKIVAVETTVEVPVEKTIYVDKIVEKIVDNTDYTTIEELRNRNNELEIQLANALNKITELEIAAITVEPKIVEPAIDTTITVGPLTIEEIIVEEETIDPLQYAFNKLNIPEEYRDNQEISYQLQFYVKKANKLSKITIEALDELLNSKCVRQDNIAVIIEKLNKQKEETITAEYKALRASNTMEEDYTYGLQGTITIDDKQYTFKWTNNHINPCLFGCMDMETILKAKAYLKETKEWKTRVDESTNNQLDKIICEKDNSLIYDFDNNIVIFKLNDNLFKGYTDKYAFVWNTKENIPCGKTIEKALTSNYRKMNQSWGNGFVARAQMIKDMCKKHFPECFESTKEEVKQIVTNTTNDEIDPDEELE